VKKNKIENIKKKLGIIGNSKLLNQAIETAIQIAPTKMNVLITGESGSGKESFSKIIHILSHYKNGKFIAINCGAIPEGTIDSELFGHRKGSFTGATESRKGYFEEASGGTIFLDEISEMPLNTQSRLLRILEYGEFIKVGSSKIKKIKLRIIAATNKNLIKSIKKFKFRKDLYYRLNTIPIYVPPLRERGNDIIFLIKKFTIDFTNQYKIKPIFLSKKAEKLILKYKFPGNIRELKNLIEYISALEKNRNISIKKINTYLPKLKTNLPILVHQKNYLLNNINNISEKKFLYKALFEIKKDLNKIKKIIFKKNIKNSSNFLKNLNKNIIE